MSDGYNDADMVTATHAGQALGFVMGVAVFKRGVPEEVQSWAKAETDGCALVWADEANEFAQRCEASNPDLASAMRSAAEMIYQWNAR